jgi:FtsH-binding integral membrane protein
MKNNTIDIKYNKFIKNISNKKIFLIKIFLTLIFEIILAYVSLLYSEKNIKDDFSIYFICIISLFVLIFLIIFISNTFIKFILLSIFSILIGIMLSFRINNQKQNEIAKQALIATIIIFVYMVLFAFFISFLGIHIPSYFAFILFISLLLLIITIIILRLNNSYSKHHKLIAGIIIFLFSIFIFYDTINILDKDYNGNFIEATLAYLLDFINLFSGELSSF